MQKVLITGASSGIGRALALRYASTDTILALLGRNVSRLENVAVECRKRGATVEMAAIDIRERAKIIEWVGALDRTHGIDLLFANAGVMEGTPRGGHIELPD